MKKSKYLFQLFLIIFFSSFIQPQLNAQSNILQYTFLDLEYNWTVESNSVGIATGVKLSKYAGFGVSLIRPRNNQNLLLLGLNFRGTNFKAGDKWGYYYSLNLSKRFSEVEYKGLAYIDLTLGLRRKRMGLGLGISNYGVQVNLSYLLNDIKGRGIFQKNNSSSAPTESTPNSPNETEEEKHGIKSKIFAKYDNDRKFFFHFLLGHGWVDNNGAIVDKNYFYEGFTYNIAAGYQMNTYLGFGLALHGGTTVRAHDKYSIGTMGLCVNGYPDIFFYNLTLGLVGGFSLVDDIESPRQEFDKVSGNPFYIDIKGGIRLFKRVTIGLGFNTSTKINGIYKMYEGPTYERTLTLAEERKSKFRGMQAFIGISL